MREEYPCVRGLWDGNFVQIRGRVRFKEKASPFKGLALGEGKKTLAPGVSILLGGCQICSKRGF